MGREDHPFGELLEEHELTPRKFDHAYKSEKENESHISLSQKKTKKDGNDHIQLRDSSHSEKITEMRQKINTLPTETETPEDEKQDSLTEYRQRIVETYGILLDDKGNPVTPTDEERMTKMLNLADPETSKINKGVFGTIKELFTGRENSEKNKLNAFAFKKDLGEYMKSLEESSIRRHTSPRRVEKVPTHSAKRRGRPRKKAA